MGEPLAMNKDALRIHRPMSIYDDRTVKVRLVGVRRLRELAIFAGLSHTKDIDATRVGDKV